MSICFMVFSEHIHNLGVDAGEPQPTTGSSAASGVASISAGRNVGTKLATPDAARPVLTGKKPRA